MKLSTLSDLFIEELKDIYSAENQLLKALPKMAKAASNERLREALETHLGETERQVERLNEIFERLEIKPGRKKCKAMEGLINEGQETISEDAEPAVHDAALIAAAQRVEHYEIAAYGCARTFASLLGHDFAVELLSESLDEEAHADTTLTEIAMGGVNQEAVEPVHAGDSD